MRQRSTSLGLSVIAALGVLLCSRSELGADIYRFVDERGVVHFSNVRTDRRYVVYFRGVKRDVKLYLRKFDSIIEDAATRFGVNPLLVKAVIKAESGADTRAVSCKGAQGLMQLMPDTASDMDVENPFDPEDNIFGGTRYLKTLLERFGQDRELALAAYNAGPETVMSYKGIPPYPETRAFVERVMKYYRQFQTERPR